MRMQFKNLHAEMARNNVSVDDIAKALHCTSQNVYAKFRGETQFSLLDLRIIQALLNGKNNGNYSIDYLFKQSGKSKNHR